jgi:oxygen-independent coproporphyrinogen-3 oxidase
MINAIVKEIRLTPKMAAAGKEIIDTIYFGGGTPSVLTVDELGAIIDAVKEEFLLAREPEITLEANPDDIDVAMLQSWRSVGINRLSVGLQSFDDEELKWMNRTHTAADSLRCIDEIFASGFTNFSIDLIYGSPLSSDEAWHDYLDLVIKKNIPHVSCYALTVEPRTALAKMISARTSAAIDPEAQARQFLILTDRMQEAGYEHYEISNFAKPGMRSRHNSSYWSQTSAGHGIPYYGFGPSAHSFDGQRRKWNIANNALYIHSIEKNEIPFEEEVLTRTQQLNEYIMTSLRTVEGIDLKKLRHDFGEDHSKELQKQAAKFIATGELLIANEHLLLSREGKLFADGIAAELFC